MLRRTVFTFAAAAAGVFVAAGPVAAAPADIADFKSGAGWQVTDAERVGAQTTNIGGAFGITTHTTSASETEKAGTFRIFERFSVN